MQQRGRPQLDSQPQLGSSQQQLGSSQPQLGSSQAQLCSQPQLCSQQQLASQQQWLWRLNKPRKPSNKQQRRPQPESQPQLGSQAQLCSQPQLGSQRAEYGVLPTAPCSRADVLSGIID
jgi:hypothetical protein